MLNFHKCTRSKLSRASAQLSSPGPCCLHKSRLLTVLTLLKITDFHSVWVLFSSHPPQSQWKCHCGKCKSFLDFVEDLFLCIVSIFLCRLGDWWRQLPCGQHVSRDGCKRHNPQSLVFPEQSRLDNFSSPLAVSEVILQSVLWELCKLSRTHRVEIGNAVRITLQPWLCSVSGERRARVTDIQITGHTGTRCPACVCPSVRC